MGFELSAWKGGLGLLSFLWLASAVDAHSWVEQLMVIAPNGTFVGTPGYSRGNVLRSSPGYKDPLMQNLVPPQGRTKLLPDDYLCKDTQRKPVQTDGSPRLQASAGAAIALRYQENGHVTQPNIPPGKPEHSGKIYVYGTTDPKEDEKIMEVHKVWNKDGTGGDRRGLLLSIQNFDDGRCYQINNGDISKSRQAKFPHAADPLMGTNLWCQTDIALPSKAPSGKPYTLYWVWDWPTFGEGAKQEIYTTCIDVDVVANPGTQSHMAAGYIQDQSLNGAAIPDQFAEIFGSGTSGSAQSSLIAGGSAVPGSSTPIVPVPWKSGGSMGPTSSRLATSSSPIAGGAATLSSSATASSSRVGGSMEPSISAPAIPTSSKAARLISSINSPATVSTSPRGEPSTSSVQAPMAMAPQATATVTSFVTMVKTVVPGCSASSSH